MKFKEYWYNSTDGDEVNFETESDPIQIPEEFTDDSVQDWIEYPHLEWTSGVKLSSLSTSWDLPNLCYISTSWNITTSSYIESGWNILWLNYFETSWEIISLNFHIPDDTQWVSTTFERLEDIQWTHLPPDSQWVYGIKFNKLDYSWNIIEEIIRDTAWDIDGVKFKDLDTAWDINAEKEAEKLDILWRILDTSSLSTSWRISIEEHLETSWHTYTTDYKNTGWLICNGSFLETAWKIENISANFIPFMFHFVTRFSSFNILHSVIKLVLELISQAVFNTFSSKMNHFVSRSL